MDSRLVQSGLVSNRIWLASLAGGSRKVTSNDFGPLDVKVSIRRPDPDQAPWDAVWVNGQRAYDTYVILDGQEYAHAPARYLSENNFDIHEQRGGAFYLN